MLSLDCIMTWNYSLIFFKIIVDLRRRIFWRVTVVLEEESWGIRISLNTTISIRVFNEILLIGFCLLSKKTHNKKKNIFLNDSLNVVWEREHELPTTDSLMSYNCPRKRNLEVWLVVLNVLIIFEMFNVTDLWKSHVFSTTSENFWDN